MSDKSFPELNGKRFFEGLDKNASMTVMIYEDGFNKYRLWIANGHIHSFINETYGSGGLGRYAHDDDLIFEKLTDNLLEDCINILRRSIDFMKTRRPTVKVEEVEYKPKLKCPVNMEKWELELYERLQSNRRGKHESKTP